MGLEERQARPHRQNRRHQQARPEIQGRRRLAKAPETARTDPGLLRRPPPALHHRITGTGRLTYALLGNVLGTWNVLEACAAASVRQVVVCSSIAAVGLDELRSDWTPDGSAGPIPATARMSGPSRAAGASA